ncbi:hypothetical protein HY933_00235 [Candidatus Falkowbacteria bacterium]|nr:hypothetical protein [Candidatus Falkowbacteria bacterium]
MINKFLNRRIISLTISWGLKVLLFLLFCLELYAEDYTAAAAALIALFLSLLPAAIERNYSINLPKVIDFAVTFSLFLHIFGLYYNLYHDPVWWWWDNMTHFLGTAVIAFLAFYIIFVFDYLGKIRLTLPFMALATWTTALAIGALWEIVEFYSDKFLGTHTAIDLADTIHDMSFNLLAAVAVSLIGVYYVNWLRKKQRHGGQ